MGWASLRPTELEVVRRAAEGLTLSRHAHGRLTPPNGESIPPTGRQISVAGMDIETWDEDGLIAGDRAYFDQLQFLTQLGLGPGA
jgi:hypothetical protein